MVTRLHTWAPDDPLSGSGFIESTTFLLKKKAVVSVQNDETCFLWAILAHLYSKTANLHRLLHINSLTL